MHRETAKEPDSGENGSQLSLSRDAAAAQQEVEGLQAEHSRLEAELAAVNQENAVLERNKEQAEHAAKLFGELAAQSSAGGREPTNVYPTIRHVLSGIGKQARLVAEMEAKWGDAENDQLPDEEQKAAEQAMLGIATEMFRLQQAAADLTGGGEDFPQPATAEGMADYSTCFLYGALELDAGQFTSVNGILEKYCQQAAEEKLLQPVADETGETTTNRLAALNALNERARSEIQTLLSPQQMTILKGSAFKQLRLVTDKFYNSGMGFGFGFGGTNGE
jgi:hypothetical protein